MADPDAEIAALDRALDAAGQSVVLNYYTGAGTSKVKYSVTCPAMVRGFTATEVIPGSGISQQDSRVIISPTQINQRQWPGPAVKGPADPRIPKAGVTDVTVNGVTKAVISAVGLYIDGTLVRIEIALKG